MNIIKQLMLNYYVLLLGATILLNVKSVNNVLRTIALSWLLGWVYLAFANIALVMIGAFYDWKALLLISMIPLVIAFINPQVNISLCKTLVIRELKGIGIFVIIISVITVLLDFCYYSPDSITIEGLSRIFHLFGRYGYTGCRVNYWIFNIRPPFLISIQNIAYMIGISVYSSFFPITSLVILSFLLSKVIIYRVNSASKVKMIFFLFITFTLCLNLVYLFHSFYSLSNMLNAVLFSSAVLLLNEYRKSNCYTSFFIACIFLGTSCVLRKEMYVFSIIPISMCFIGKNDFIYRKILFGMILYMITAYAWPIWGEIKFGDVFEFGNSLSSDSSHGGNIILIFTCFSSLAIFIAASLIGKLRLRDYLSLVFLLNIIILAFYYNEYFVSFLRLVKLMFISGKWYFFWYMIFVVSPIVLILKKRVDLFVSNSYLLLNILVFLMFRLILYSLYDTTWDEHWTDSGNRVLLHIFPVCLFWLFLIVSDLSNELEDSIKETS